MSGPDDQSPSLPAAVPRPARAGRILLVEDDADIRASVNDVLVAAGYVVVTSEQGREALDLLAVMTPPPDAIVLDLCLPIMDGWEFRTRQRADPAFSRIPVLAISADPSAKAAAIDADGYLRKPFEARDLLRELGRILLERDNRQAMERLEHTQRLTAIGAMAAGVAHEIRNPLTFVRGNLQLIGRSTSLEEIRTLTSEAMLGLDRIVAIVQDMVALARPSDARRGSVAVQSAMEVAIHLAAHQLPRGARLVRDYRSAPVVLGDETRLAQVFLNLLINACQAVSTERGRPRMIRTGIRQEGKDVVVEVEDTGVGIPPALKGRVFMPFFTTKPAREGSGLGLSICRDIVVSHGGTIDFESEPGKGSLFRVVLPASEPPA